MRKALRAASKEASTKRPDHANPKMIGNHVYRHEAKTSRFVDQWYTMMLRLAWVLGAGASWSTYQLVKEKGLAVSPALAFELSSLAVAGATTAWLQSGGHPVAMRLCAVLVGLQLFGYASHLFNCGYPADQTPAWIPGALLEPVRDFVLPEDAFPLGAVYFFVCNTARRFMGKQLKVARDSVREFEGLPIAAVLTTSGVGVGQVKAVAEAEKAAKVASTKPEASAEDQKKKKKKQ